MNSISLIWLIFTILFAVLAGLSFNQAGKKIIFFNIADRPMKNAIVQVKGVDIDQPLKNFVEDFNKYIEAYNGSSKAQNRIAGFGYIAAALVSAVSFLLETKIIN
jgi:hypothetical protein